MPKKKPAFGFNPDRFNEHCLNPGQLLEFEARSLTKMQSLSWPRSLSLWRGEIQKAVREAKSQASLNAHVSFEAPNPRAGNLAEPLHQIELGVQIMLSKPPHLVTYFLAIGEKDGDNKRRMLRKIHFDLQDAGATSEPKPTVHLQVAGGPSPPLIRLGYEVACFDHLNPGLEKPRIPCLPQSFALLLHMAFLEYHSTDEDLKKFMSSPGWLSVVAEAEMEVLKPFFNHGNEWLASSRSQSLLSSFYGLSDHGTN